MTSLTLYQRDECHLCDLALAVLAGAGTGDFDSVFIDGDSALEARYGDRVPVLRCAAPEEELGWPFTRQEVEQLLQRQKHSLANS